MPQELRWPEKRTDEVSEEVIKFLNFYCALPSYSNRGMSDLAFLINWGDIYESDLDLIDVGLRTSDMVFSKQEPEKPNTMKIKGPQWPTE